MMTLTARLGSRATSIASAMRLSGKRCEMSAAPSTRPSRKHCNARGVYSAGEANEARSCSFLKWKAFTSNLQ